MQQVPHCPRCGRNNHVYLYKNYDDDNLDHRLAAAENRDDSLHRLRAIAADRFRLGGVLLLLLGCFFLGGFLCLVAGVGLVVVGFVLVRDRTADLVDHAPAAVHGARAGGPPAGLRATTGDYAAAATALRRRTAFRAGGPPAGLRATTADYAAAATALRRRRTAFRADAADTHDAGSNGRLAALFYRDVNVYIGERTKFCFFIPTDSSKTYICDYKH
jgi:hypothetical protein